MMNQPPAPPPATSPLSHAEPHASAQAHAVPLPVQSTALARAAHPVLEADDATYTAAELAHTAATLAALLAAEEQVRPGDLVALLGPPSSEWVVAVHALGWLGATLAPLPATATPAERAQQWQALATHGELKLVLSTAGEEEAEAIRQANAATGHAVGQLLQRARSRGFAPLPERFWPLAEPRVLILTSGTTAAPRPVVLTTAQLMFNTFGTASRIGHLPSDRWLCVLPLHHIGGLAILYRAAWLGTTVRLPAQFDAAEVAVQLDSGEIALVSLVPTMLERVLDARRGPHNHGEPDAPLPSSLRAILLGGAHTPASLRERCRRMRAPVALTWGMSETASQVATRYPGDLDETAPGIPPLPFVRVSTEAPPAVAEGTGPVERASAPAESGVGRASVPAQATPQAPGHADNQPAGTREFGVGRASVPAQATPQEPGHADNQPAANAKPLLLTGPQAPAGVYTTSDVGYTTTKGRVVVTGRRDDIIISGGKNIVPDEIEHLLRQHPAVDDAVVVGIPDPHWGEAVVAVLVPASPVEGKETTHTVVEPTRYTAKQQRQPLASLDSTSFRAAKVSKRKRLPHWRLEGATYFVTLALHREQKRRKLDDQEREVVYQALHHFNNQRYDLTAWTVMPDHAYVIVTPYPGMELSKIVASWKSFTANRLQHESKRRGAIWEEEAHDRILRDQCELIDRVKYVLRNPVRHGLCQAEGADPFTGCAGEIVSGAHGGPPYGDNGGLPCDEHGAFPCEAELRWLLRERLAGYKMPRWFAWWPQPLGGLPRTELGKVRRSAVQERLLAEPAAFGLLLEVLEQPQPP